MTPERIKLIVDEHCTYLDEYNDEPEIEDLFNAITQALQERDHEIIKIIEEESIVIERDLPCSWCSWCFKRGMILDRIKYNILKTNSESKNDDTYISSYCRLWQGNSGEES
jgi:hypothetical protein